jgi:hypothetical protein
MKRWLARALVAGLLGFVVLQLLPFDRIEERPTTQEAPWPSAEARQLAVSACYDCHSNEPQLEWFDRIAPGSWLVARHVADGRAEVNFSEWDREQESDDWAKVVEDGEMPPRSYTWAHPAARLTSAEKATLLAALEQLEEPDDDRGGGDDDEG